MHPIYTDSDNLKGGFTGHLRPGKKPILLLIDFQRAFTDETISPLGGDFSEAIACANRLIQAARPDMPIIFTVVAYSSRSLEPRLFGTKCPPLLDLTVGSDACQLDPRLDYRDGEDLIIHKSQASAFFGTHLAAILSTQQCDMLVIGGVTTSGCVRASAVDAMQYGFPPFVASDAVADRSLVQHDANLTDLQCKYAEVLTTKELLRQLPPGSS